MDVKRELLSALESYKEWIDEVFFGNGQTSGYVYDEGSGIEIFVYPDEAIAVVEDWLYRATLTYDPSLPYLRFYYEGYDPSGTYEEKCLIDWEGNIIFTVE